MEAPISTSTNIPRIDAHLSKFSQACVVVLTGVAFILAQPVIVLIAAIAMALTALVPAVSPFRLLYRYVMLPLHLLKPRIVEDDPAPHRFAQAVGATFLIASTLVLFLAHAAVVGFPRPGGGHGQMRRRPEPRRTRRSACGLSAGQAIVRVCVRPPRRHSRTSPVPSMSWPRTAEPVRQPVTWPSASTWTRSAPSCPRR